MQAPKPRSALALHTSELKTSAGQLRAGQRVWLSGVVYTARDAAHKRLCTSLEQGESLPFALQGAVLYYAGPTPTPPGHVIGSCGPTTSSRMDPYTPMLLRHGLCATIGKGERSLAVCAAMCAAGAVYFAAVGGAGALAAQCVVACQEIAYADLGCESIKRLELHEFPLTVAIDAQGGNLYKRP